MTIEEWISKLEADTDLTLEEFYSKLVQAKQVLEERLEVADADGIDIENLDTGLDFG